VPSLRAREGSRDVLDLVPDHALLIVEERLKEQQAEGVRMPEGVELGELALRILIAAETVRHVREDSNSG
jgi:hypothetical protein